MSAYKQEQMDANHAFSNHETNNAKYVNRMMHGEGSWMPQNGGAVARPAAHDQQPIRSSLISPVGAPFGAPAYGMPDPVNQSHVSMPGFAQQKQRTPFQQPAESSQNHQYTNSFGKAKSGQTLADSKDSWRSDSKTWRSGGGNPESSNTWRTTSGSGWREAGDKRSGGSHHGSHQYGSSQGHGHQGQHGSVNQMQSMMQTMSLNGKHLQASVEHTVSIPATFGPGGGRHGMIPFGPSRATRRYGTELLAKIYRQLLYTGRLGLPGGVQRDEPMLFTSAGEFVDVVEQLQGVARRPKNAYIDMSSFYMSRDNSMEVGGGGGRGGGSTGAVVGMGGMGGMGSMGGMGGMGGMSSMGGLGSMGGMALQSMLVGGVGMQQVSLQAQQATIQHDPMQQMHQAHAQQQDLETYMYVDPQGQWQGPFKREEILEWHAAGYFPLDLVVKRSNESQLARLSDWLAIWNGKRSSAAEKMQVPVAVSVQQVVQQLARPKHSLAAAPRHHEPVVDQGQNQQPEREQEPVVAPLKQRAPEIASPAPLAATPQIPPEAPWMGSQSVDSAVSLREIQQEEDTKKAELDEIKAIAVTEQQKLRNSHSGWASVARSDSMSLADIQNEEIKANQSKYALEAAAAAASFEKQQQKIASGGVWAAAASKSAAMQVPLPAPKPVANATTVKPKMSSLPPPPPEKSRVASVPTINDAPVDSSAFGSETLASDEGTLSGDFRQWCAQQMETLTGSGDVTLCEFLMGVESNSEIADYIGMYLGASAPVATFSSEFIKRKLAVVAAREATAGGKKKSRKARAKANKALASVSSGNSEGASTRTAEEDSSWEKVAKAGKGTGTAERSMSNGGVRPGPAKTGFALLSGRAH